MFRDIAAQPRDRRQPADRLPRGARAATRQSTPTWRYWPATAGAITYNKTALWLHTLERCSAGTTLQRIMSTYFARWAFKHPQPEDFFAVVNEVSGQDLTWFFDQVYRSSNVVRLRRRRRSRASRDVDRGYFGDGEPADVRRASAPGDVYRTTVVVRRYGEGVFPVDVRVVFENGEEVRWQWDGRDRWKTVRGRAGRCARSRRRSIRSACCCSTSTTRTTPRRSRRKPDAAARKWSLAWLIWLQDHLLTYGFFV